MKEKVPEARKGTAFGAFARGSGLQWLDDLRQGRPLVRYCGVRVLALLKLIMPCTCVVLHGTGSAQARRFSEPSGKSVDGNSAIASTSDFLPRHRPRSGKLSF
jgi:hypothetical protein